MTEPQSIDFKIQFTGPDYESLILLVKDGSTYKPYLDSHNQRVELRDNGASPDLTANDGSYAANASLAASEAGVIEVAAGVKVDGEWKLASKPSTLTVNTKLSETEVKKITEVNDNLVKEITSLQSPDSTVEEIKESIQKVLTETEEVKDTGVTDTGVWYVLDSGVLGAVTIPSGSVVDEGIAAFALDTHIESGNATEVTVGNRRVVVYSAHNKSDSSSEVIKKLEGSSIAYNIDNYIDETATVDNFKEMFNYGTIIFDSKGANLFGEDLTKNYPELDGIFGSEDELVIILTGEEASNEKNNSYNADLKTGRIAVVDGYYAITPAFVKYYAGNTNLPNSLVYANSAYSAGNDSLANQFINNGALTYLGHENEVKPGMAMTFENLLTDGTAVQDAVSAEEKVHGNKELAYTKTSHLVNGSFEDTSGVGWVSGGHFDIIDRLGANINKEWHTLSPKDGSKYMGIISSGLDESVLNGRQSWVYQTFSVPEDVNVLKIDYNVVSNEPMEYLNSGFDDTFKATIIEGAVKEPQEDEYLDETYEGIYNVPWLESTVDADETIIAYESVNSSDWGQTYEDDRQRVDARFPSGDETTYMTGWKTLTYDVSKYKGQTITLKLQTWDLGDKIFPTAVLFDNVRLTNSTASGLIVEGVSDVIIPSYGSREYQFNALLTDEFGDKLTGAISLRENKHGFRQPVHVQEGIFSLKEQITGVEINSETGLLNVSDLAEPGEITIIATGNGQTVEHKVTLKPSSGYIYEEDFTEEQDYLNELFNILNEKEYVLPVGTEDTPDAKREALEKLIIEDINNSDVDYSLEEHTYYEYEINRFDLQLSFNGYGTEIRVYVTIASGEEEQVKEIEDLNQEVEQIKEIE